MDPIDFGAQVAVVLLACTAYGAIPAGWNYDPFLYYPYTALQPPVQETPEVAAARAAHMAAKAAAENPIARTIPTGWNYNPFLYYPYTGQPAPVQETAEVAAARAAHMAAHAQALSRSTRSVIFHVEGQQESAEQRAERVEHYKAYTAAARSLGADVPAVYLDQGIQDTPEVWAAKQEFYRLYNEAVLRSG